MGSESVPLDLMKGLAESVTDSKGGSPAEPPRKPERPVTGSSTAPKGTGTFNLDDLMSRHFPDHEPRAEEDGGRIWGSLPCSWRPSDGNTMFVRQLPNGAISAGCQHDSCDGSRTTGNHWRGLRLLLDGPFEKEGRSSSTSSTTTPGGTPPQPLLKFDTQAWGIRKPKEIAWLIQNQLALGETGILAGPPNCGKGLLSMQYALNVALGNGLFGWKGSSSSYSVIIVQMEDSQEEMERRFVRCLDELRQEPRWREKHEEALRRNLTIFGPDWSAEGSKDLTSLVPSILKEAEAHNVRGVPVGLIIIDTFTAVSEGDENSVEAQRKVWPSAYALRDKTGANVMLVHHVRKSASGDKGMPVLDRLSPDSLRGSTAIVGGARCILQMEPLKVHEAVKLDLDADKARRGGYAVLAMTKVVSGPKGAWVLLEQQNTGFWARHSKSDELCAQLQSKVAAEELGLDEAILLSIYGGSKDRKELREKHWPNESAERQAVLLKAAMNRLRNRHGWVQRGASFDLTAPGVAKARALEAQGNQPGDLEEPIEMNEDKSVDFIDVD